LLAVPRQYVCNLRTLQEDCSHDVPCLMPIAMELIECEQVLELLL